MCLPHAPVHLGWSSGLSLLPSSVLPSPSLHLIPPLPHPRLISHFPLLLLPTYSLIAPPRPVTGKGMGEALPVRVHDCEAGAGAAVPRAGAVLRGRQAAARVPRVHPHALRPRRAGGGLHPAVVPQGDQPQGQVGGSLAGMAKGRWVGHGQI